MQSSTGLWGCCSEHGRDVRHPKAGDPLLRATVDWDERGQKILGDLLQNVFLLTTFCSATPLTRLEIKSKLAVLSTVAFQKCKQKLRQPLGASWDQTTPRTNRRATYPASRPTQYITTEHKNRATAQFKSNTYLPLPRPPGVGRPGSPWHTPRGVW